MNIQIELTPVEQRMIVAALWKASQDAKDAAGQQDRPAGWQERAEDYSQHMVDLMLRIEKAKLAPEGVAVPPAPVEAPAPPPKPAKAPKQGTPKVVALLTRCRKEGLLPKPLIEAVDKFLEAK